MNNNLPIEIVEQLENYKKLKQWLFQEGIDIPISIEPYTYKEYLTRQNLPKLYWSKRDAAAANAEQRGPVPWLDEAAAAIQEIKCETC